MRVNDVRVVDGKDKSDDSEVNSGRTRPKKKLGNDFELRVPSISDASRPANGLKS